MGRYDCTDVDGGRAAPREGTYNDDRFCLKGPTHFAWTSTTGPRSDPETKYSIDISAYSYCYKYKEKIIKIILLDIIYGIIIENNYNFGIIVFL